MVNVNDKNIGGGYMYSDKNDFKIRKTINRNTKLLINSEQDRSNECIQSIW